MPKKFIDQQSIHVNDSGYISVIDMTDNYTIALAYDGSGNLEYQGKAMIGSAKGSALWQIKKMIYDGSGNLTDVQWADGNDAFDNIWDNRAGLSYS